jgi:hypothetical protein
VPNCGSPVDSKLCGMLLQEGLNAFMVVVPEIDLAP